MEDGDPRIGTTLKGKWRLDARLGIGGMASVYAATHRNGKRVAVKILHAELSAITAVRARFLREGYVANAVGHRGAVTVDDDDVAEDGSAFLVMELLEGETLEARRQRWGGALPPAEVLGLVDQLLDVLAAAHDKGIVHRDVKPENLFLTHEGTLKVLDFGIARLREGSVDAAGTRIGSIMGTPAFMAPEQARARWDLVDGRTDLWAVGATMYTLLSGRFVRQGTTANEELAIAMTTQVPSVAVVAPHLSPRIVDLVDRAMAYGQEHRWASAQAMREALHAALAGAGEHAFVPAPTLIDHASAGTISPGSSTIRSTASGPGRGRPWIGLAAGLAVLAIGAVVWVGRGLAGGPSTEPTHAAGPAGVSAAPTPEPSALPTAQAISVADLPDLAPQTTTSAAVPPSRSRATTPTASAAAASVSAASARPAATPAPSAPAREAPLSDPFSSRR